jgi:hypothetical protein
MDVLKMILMFGALIMVMSAIGMPLSAIVRASKVPAWAKPNPAIPWGRPWIDSRPWIKKVLIKLGQGIIFTFLFLINFFWHAIKALTSKFVKVLEGAAKSAVKKK